MKQTRWAMVGTGLMLRLIGRDFAQTENVDLRVIVSRTQERADAAAAEYGIAEGSADLESVLQRDDIDAVYVATPHSLHFPQAMAALKAGKHVLVEKAMTPNATLTRELFGFAQAQGLFAMEAMWTAFNPAIIEMRRRVANGDIGEVQLVEANFSTAPAYDASARIWAQDLAGGSTWDQGVYTLSFAHMLLGAPQSITARGTVIEKVDGEAVAILDYAGGQRAVCINGLRAFSPLTAFIAGSRGYITLDPAFWQTGGFTLTHCESQADTTTERFTYEREGAGYVPMLRAVSQAIFEGRTEHPSRTHAESIAVAESMDEVVRQVLGR